MSAKPIFKHPDDIRRVRFDATDWLRGAGISTATWDTSEVPLSVANSSTSGNVCTTYIQAGGTLNEEYQIHLTIVTDETPSRTKTFTFLIKLEYDVQ